MANLTTITLTCDDDIFEAIKKIDEDGELKFPTELSVDVNITAETYLANRQDLLTVGYPYKMGQMEPLPISKRAEEIFDNEIGRMYDTIVTDVKNTIVSSVKGSYNFPANTRFVPRDISSD